MLQIARYRAGRGRRGRGGRRPAVEPDRGFPAPTPFARAFAAGIGAALCQAVNLVAAKQAMLLGDLSPLSATLVRTTVAVGLLWGLVAGRGGLPQTVSRVGATGRC